LAVQDLEAFAQTAIELKDAGMAKQAMKQARATKAEHIVQMLLSSGLVATTKAGRTWATTEKARKAALDRGYQVLTDGDFSYLQSVEYQCPAGHTFVAKPKAFAQQKQPCPNCAANEVARTQVNVRLTIEHSKQYLELIEYYGCKESLTFLGDEISGSDIKSNATALGRFLLETAIDDAYMELQDQKLIEEIAGWISFDSYDWIAKAAKGLEGRPLYHKENNTPEWQAFLEADAGRLGNDYQSAAISEWGEQLGDIYFCQFWDQALMLALQNYEAKVDEPIEDSIDILRRMRRWNRNKS